MKPSRRDFLESSIKTSTLMALASRAPTLLCHTAQGAGPGRPGQESTALVVVQLSGGNDGLNCVVPYADDNYARLRTTLRLKRNDVLRIDDHFGFHPEMKECRRLFDEGCFSVLQGVGYPKSSRDHPAAERSWQGGLPESPGNQTGWVGRYADCLCDKIPGGMPAALLTPTGRPFAVTAERTVIPQLRKPEDAELFSGPASDDLASGIGQIAGANHGDSGSLLEFVRTGMATAVADRAKVRAAMANASTYPQTQFAQRLRTIASLIRADVGFRLYYTELGGDGFGGFDNHANQKENHAALLAQFSGGVGAFLDDLRRDGAANRTLLMTISEFGRTAAENGRRGTDHGAAAPVFLAGGRIKHGLIGAHPSLSDLDNNGLRFHTDFRRVYATVLDRWLGCDPRTVLGEPFEPVDFLS